jgi:hypothetical protein
MRVIMFERVRGEAGGRDLRRIKIYPDRKVGTRYDGAPYPDLLRSAVQNLTEAEWYSAPSADWDSVPTNESEAERIARDMEDDANFDREGW